MHNNQQGLSHIIVAALLTLVVAVVGVAAYRVGVSTAPQNQSGNANQQPLVNDLKVEEEKSESVKVPSEQKKTEPVKEEPKSEPVVKEEVKTDYNKDKVYLDISLVSAAQDGSKVNVKSTIEKSVRYVGNHWLNLVRVCQAHGLFFLVGKCFTVTTVKPDM